MVSIPDLSDADKALLAKNNINDKLHFKEHRQKWWPVIKARLTGVLFTTLTSIGLTLWSEAKFLPQHARFDYQETKWGKKLGDNVVAKIPGVSWVFNNPRPIPEMPNINGHQLIGKYFIDDMIYTLMSKLGFDLMERRNDKKVLLEEASMAKQDAHIAKAAAAQAERAALRAENALSKEEVSQKLNNRMGEIGFDMSAYHDDASHGALLAQAEADSAIAAAQESERAARTAQGLSRKETASDVRQKIIAAGPKDAMSHAVESQNQPAIALS